MVTIVYSSNESFSTSLPGCKNTCGNITIPYPFGIPNSSKPNQETCFLSRKFNVTCVNDTKLLWGNVQVNNISIPEGQMEVSFSISSYCDNVTWIKPSLDTASFRISSKENKFVTVGCDSYGYLNSVFNKKTYSTGCLTRCYGNRDGIENGTCSGIGCCQVDIPHMMRNISVKVSEFPDSTENTGCSSSFIVKNGFYNFSLSHLDNFPSKKLPLILDWSIGSENCTVSNACKNNSECIDLEIDSGGYRCKCKERYTGNPYHPDGCTDIDECNQKMQHLQECKDHRQLDLVTKISIGTSAGLIVLFVAISSLYLTCQKRKLIKLKQKFFQQNGGSILLQQLSTGEDSSQSAHIFTEEELKKATKNYDESLVLAQSSKEFYPATRSLLNVVKLLGCCLETEVPSLVYEFVSHGTLFDFIQSTKDEANNPTWKTRLRIAAETAGALSYLHSAAAIPIIHRDVKSTNILLDENYTAKVSDFGASRLVPLDQTEIATMVQGTLGYLDPEYMQTHQLTEKSDVYSFGVVLAELLTGDKPLSFNRPEESISLSMHFLSCLKQDKIFEAIQVGILSDDNKKDIKEVAILAARCLRLRGEERPSMKEVAMELEGIRLTDRHPWTDTEQNFEENQRLLS
ncbi:putative wall-associated receptor kinase [Trifolium repens]|nr:putative wall-associated receptor kinase [Trifolium repens]